MIPLLQNPFENNSWGDYDIDLVLLLSPKAERILVGARAAILSRLKGNDISPTLSRTSSETSMHHSDSSDAWVNIAEKIHTVTEIIIESAITNPIEALEKRRIQQDRCSIESAPLLCDCSFEIGHFLIGFEYDANEMWSRAITSLATAQTEKSSRKKAPLLDAAKEILLAKWNSGDPVCQFVSLRIWQEYLRDSASFAKDMTILTRVFSIPRPIAPLPSGRSVPLNYSVLRLPFPIHSEDEQLQLWTPTYVNAVCAVLGKSFVPLKLYYRDYLNQHGKKFCICSVCKKLFLSDTAKQKTCSDSCQQVRTKATKARYDARVRQDPLETYFKQEHQFWYSRVKRARETSGFPPERLVQIEAAFAAYSKESLKQKKLAKRSAESLRTFQTWAFDQEKIIIQLMGEYECRPRRRKNAT